MKFGIFYEHQLPRPWNEGGELALFQEALDQVELADRLGLDYAWEVEHHFLEEYSHSSAPEVFLGGVLAAHAADPARARHRAACRRATTIPRRVAGAHRDARPRLERAGGVRHRRVVFAARSSGATASTRAEKREMWLRSDRAGREHARDGSLPGLRGQSTSRCPAATSCRSRCRSRIRRCGSPARTARRSRSPLGSASARLTFAFVDPAEARHWVDDYYETFERECVPIGRAVNPNVAMVTGFSCHRDGEEARRRGLDGFRFFGFALGALLSSASTSPGRTNIWKAFESVRDAMPDEPGGRGIGTPDELREHLASFEATGVDQVIFIQQGGRNRHEHICESLELFATEVMPEFKERAEARLRAQAERLAPAIERGDGPEASPRAPDPTPRSRPIRRMAGRSRIPRARRDRRGSLHPERTPLGGDLGASDRQGSCTP